MITQAVLYGAAVGGAYGTVIGASANVVALSIVISSAYLYIFYL